MLSTNIARANMFLVTAIIFAFAWWLQTQFVLNWDVSQLLYQARLMANGGNYVKDFFSPNPPMISLIYWPPIFFSKVLSINLPFVFKTYIFLLATTSLLVCYRISRSLFLKASALYIGIFICALAVALWIVPLYEFGQRDHLYMIFIMPYILTIIARAQGIQFRQFNACFIGFCAGIGVSFKPQFLLIPLFLECYYLVIEKKRFSWVRPELLCMAIVVMGHIIWILNSYPEFILVVIPYMRKLYYSSVGAPVLFLASRPLQFFCITAPILFYIFQYKNNPYRFLINILMLCLIAAFFLYLLQGNLLYYHMIPLVSFAVILLPLQFYFFIKSKNKSKLILSILLGLYLFIFVETQIKVLWTYLLFFPQIYFVFFFVLFFILLLVFQRNARPLYALALTSTILLVSVFISHMAQRTDFYPHHFLIVTSTLLVLFGVLSSSVNATLANRLCTSTLATFLFLSPLYFLTTLYVHGSEYKQIVFSQLLSFMNAQPHKQSIYVLSERTDHLFPLLDYTDSTTKQRPDCTWEVRGLVGDRRLYGDKFVINKIKNPTDDMLFFKLILQDLQENKPDLIFVDAREHNTGFQGRSDHFDFVKYFSENKEFGKMWRSYRYLTTLEGKGWNTEFRLDVYKRI